MSQKVLHVACGDAAVGNLGQALRCGREAILADRDCLVCGPLQPLRSPEQWGEMREAFS